MDKLKATLGRKVGPFTIGAWLIVVVVGVGIGLMVRKRFAGGGGREDQSGQAAVGSFGDDFPYGIVDGTIVTGRAPDTVYIPGPDEPVISDPVDPIIGRPPGDRGPGTGIDKPVPVPLPKPVPPKAPPKTGAPAGKTYVVQKGDTLWKIARAHGFSHWRPIYDANVKTIGPNPDLIRPGQRLVIPAK